ncbi:MAG: hypothetical protein AAF928_00130 [Myxococcota bacterium]
MTPRHDTVAWDVCERLAGAACDGTETSWTQLTEHLWDYWLRRIRSHRAMGSLARDEDHVHDVAARLVDKLAPRGGAALGLYPSWRDRNPNRTFRDWMNIVLTFTVRDHVRATLGQRRTRDPDLPSVKRLLNEFSTSAAIEEVGGWRPQFTAAHWLRQMLDLAASHLRDDQYAALTLWLQGARYDEMGAFIDGVDAATARNLVRSAVAILRRRFAGARP